MPSMIRMMLVPACAVALIAGCRNDDSTKSMSAASRGDAVSLGASGAGAEDGDVEVSLDECPDAVRETIVARRAGGAIIEIERTTDHGEVLYEVDVRTDDGVIEFDVAADGTFRGYEGADDDDDVADDDDDDDGDDDDERAIPLADVPEVVMNAALAAVPGIVFEEASTETEDGATVYELEGEVDGVEYEVEVSADGTVLEVETDDDDDDDDDD